MMGAPQVIANRYRCSDPLGSGAMGDVCLAADTQTGETVAIKALKPEIVKSSPGLVERFRREGEALRDLNHPNIVTLLDVVEQEGGHYLVMEYVPGGDLHALLDASPGGLPLDRALTIALELADALTRAHHLGIVHRDLKPANVLLAADGTPRLTDFGFAHFVGRDSLTHSGDVIGTLYYLSPEAIMDEALDERADIWSFGVLVYEMLAGRRPFGGTSPAAVFNAILNNPLPDLSELREDVSDPLLDLLYRMLDKSRDSRIPTIRLVGAELEAVIRGSDLVVAARDTFAPPTADALERRHNLPAQTTPFVGRAAELDDLARLFDDPAIRLVTLLGPGGSGKTRLGLEFACRRYENYSHGSYFVSLAPLNSADHIVSTVGEAVNLSFGQGDPRQQLVNYFRNKEMLLVMDNYEHLLEGVGLVAEILDNARGMQVIATSRERLNLGAECVYEVGGLEVPEHAEHEVFEELESVEMFTTYARRALPGYELQDVDRPAIVRICQLVGGMPLGIELAAAWARSLPPDEIAAELEAGLDFLATERRDLPERQRSMRAMFEHSWRLLSEAEQGALMKLAVFRGGFTREAAQAVAGARVRTLAALVDRSLLRRDAHTGRYDIHELLRQFATERLRESGREEAIRQGHVMFFQALAERIGPEWYGLEGAVWRSRCAKEHENLRAALDWLINQSDGETALRMIITLRFFWLPGEGDHWLSRALEVSGDAPPALRARALDWRAGCLENLGADYNLVIALGEEALALAQEAGDRETLECIYHNQGVSFIGRDFGEARRCLNEAVSIAREQGRTWVFSLAMLGSVDFAEGNLTAARAIFEECRLIAEEEGDTGTLLTAISGLGEITLYEGEYDQAVSYLDQALTIGRKMGDAEGIAMDLMWLGEAAIQKGELDRAQSLLAESAVTARDTELKPRYRWIFWIFARLAAARGQHRRAARLLGAVEPAHRFFQLHLEPIHQPAYERDVAALRDRLGDAAFEAAFAEGNAMTLDEAIEYALEGVVTG